MFKIELDFNMGLAGCDDNFPIANAKLYYRTKGVLDVVTFWGRLR